MSEIFHMLRIGKNQYLTMKAPKTKTLYMSFKELKTAHKCKEFIEHHKKKYGTWPSLNMDRDYEQIEMDRMSTIEPLYIDQKNLEQVEELMQRSGTGVMHCYEFGMIPIKNSFTLTFRAQELDVQLDLERYTESLEDTIDS